MQLMTYVRPYHYHLALFYRFSDPLKKWHALHDFMMLRLWHAMKDYRPVMASVDLMSLLLEFVRARSDLANM